MHSHANSGNKENAFISLQSLESEFKHPFSAVYIVFKELGAVNLNIKYTVYSVVSSIGNYNDHSFIFLFLGIKICF